MDIIAELRDVARNLWWTWQPAAIALFRDIDPNLWREVNHNPLAFLARISADNLTHRATELASESRISYTSHRLREYVEHGPCWGNVGTSPLQANPVAYFSAEFGLHESIPIYSGGLGLLAGDYLKSASDLGIPMVGVGLLYAQGYFNQRLDASGWQQESYFETDLAALPIERVLEKDGRPVLVSVETRSETIKLALWEAHVGRTKLLLLDSDVEANSPHDRELTGRLYGGDSDVRIRQELILGVGGVRALEQIGIRPAVLHLNEGHSAFAILETARRELESDGVDAQEALRRVRARTVFTTHTPVEAGHDRFDIGRTEQVIGPLRDRLGLSPHDLMALGRVNPDDPNEPFCMTVLGLKSAWKSNAVSALHGRITRRMWRGLWRDRVESEIPIGHTTNGVHLGSWLAPPVRQLYDSVLGPNWERNIHRSETWERIRNVNDVELWEAHQIAKARLISYVHRQVCAQEAKREGTSVVCAITKKRLDPAVLTIGFARRFATYKRSDLWLSDIDRFARILLDTEKPVQFVIAGKAHPNDDPGKSLIQRIFRMSCDDRFRGRIALLEDYDINVARHLVQGVDVWLNTPRRPLEACGTSGMKALFNNVLNCSILDGWWAEAYNGSNGFAIGSGGEHVDPALQDRRDAEALFTVLEEEVVPLFYDRDERGIPRRWVERIKNALVSLAWRFNADRMVIDYATKCYLPAVGAASNCSRPLG